MQTIYKVKKDVTLQIYSKHYVGSCFLNAVKDIFNFYFGNNIQVTMIHHLSASCLCTYP